MLQEVSAEETDNMPNRPEESPSYKQYRGLGGIINEKDYVSALAKTKSDDYVELPKPLKQQVDDIAKFSGIELYDGIYDLYRVLRTDERPEKTKHHHSQMSDQRIFAEVLRMLGDAPALQKMIEAYPNISFS